jgi:hypothetical protein
VRTLCLTAVKRTLSPWRRYSTVVTPVGFGHRRGQLHEPDFCVTYCKFPPGLQIAEQAAHDLGR